MSDKVVPIKPGPTFMSGLGVCMSCRHEWRQRAEVGTIWLDCPACKLQMGRFAGPVDVAGDYKWMCACRSTIFHVTPDHISCVTCGNTYAFSEL